MIYQLGDSTPKSTPILPPESAYSDTQTCSQNTDLTSRSPCASRSLGDPVNTKSAPRFNSRPTREAGPPKDQLWRVLPARSPHWMHPGRAVSLRTTRWLSPSPAPSLSRRLRMPHGEPIHTYNSRPSPQVPSYCRVCAEGKISRRQPSAALGIYGWMRLFF